MKAYVDLDQSKKLMEILPLESADMKWYFWKDEIDSPKIPTFGYDKVAAESYKDTEAVYLPCWSLASLYNILPNNKEKSTDLTRGGWDMDPLEYNDKWWCEYEDESEERVSVSADNPVDACYEMIIKLHKLNKLVL